MNEMNNNKILHSNSEIQNAWLAALIDGEGTVSFTLDGKTHIRPYVEIANTSRLLLATIKELTNAGYIGGNSKRDGGPTKIAFSGNAASELLRRVLPYLLIKRLNAILYLAYRRYRKHQGISSLTEVDVAFLEKMLELNRKHSRMIRSNKVERLRKYIADHPRKQKQISAKDVLKYMKDDQEYTQRELERLTGVSSAPIWKKLQYLIHTGELQRNRWAKNQAYFFIKTKKEEKVKDDEGT